MRPKFPVSYLVFGFKYLLQSSETQTLWEGQAARDRKARTEVNLVLRTMRMAPGKKNDGIVLMGKGVGWLGVLRVRLKSGQWGWDQMKQKASDSKLEWEGEGQCPGEQSGQAQNTSSRQVARKQAGKSLIWDKWTCPHDSTIWNDKGFQGRAICLLSRL